MTERNKPRTCKNCIHNIIYEESDDNMHYIGTEKLFYVCMLTDADIEPEDTCNEFEEKEE